MKSVKKILALVLATLMIVACFAACGGNETPENNDDAKTIKIGVQGPLTGGAAQYGIAVANAAKLAVEEINAAGGINGTKLEVITADDQATPGDIAVNAYNNLVDNGMQIFLGTVTTGAGLDIVPLTAEDNIFQLTPSASGDKIIESGDNCFQICFTDSNQGSRSAQYIAENGLATKVAVIYDSADAYSTGIYNNFKAEAANRGLELVAEQAFQTGNKDFSAQVQACKAAGAELVFLPIYYTEASLILDKANSIGYEPKFFGCDGLDGILGIDGFDASLAEGVMLLTPFAADAADDATQKFVSAYKAKYNNEIPNQFAADAYDGVYIIAELLKQEGITADMTASEICDKLKVAICADGFSYMGITGAGAPLTWDASGAVSKDPAAVIIENGAYKSL